VAENIFAGRYPRRGWSGLKAIDGPRMLRETRALLARLNLDIDPAQALGRLPVAMQQLVAIARALSVEAKVLILDEPTSSLDDSEVAQLFKILRHLKQSGIAILFVTHFIEQTYAISDRITVMRNGEREGEYLARDLSADQLVSKMVGHERMSARLREAAHEASRPEELSPDERAASAFIELRGVGRRGTLQPIDLDVRRGQILGLAGLLGSGRTETARLLFGADRADSGTMLVDGKPVRLRSPHDAVRHGIAYCAEDRKKEGIVADLSIPRTSCWPCRRGAVGGARSAVSAHENWPSCG
jgi:simple sugar transport system ATP-binding protein